METSALSTALDKLRVGDSSHEPHLTDAEVRALSTYLVELTSSSSTSESEHVLCKQIRMVLQACAVRAKTDKTVAEQSFQRSNNALRAAIDVFLVSDFARVPPCDVQLLQATLARLQQMDESGDGSTNQARLAQLIMKCLENYNAWIVEHPPETVVPVKADYIIDSPPPTETLAPEEPVDSSDGGITLDIQGLLSRADQRVSITELEGTAIAANLRPVVIEGALFVDGDIPEDLLLTVEGGGVTIAGSVSGYVIADGDISVRGNALGGWMFSRQGTIQSSRVLASATAIAPRGNITVESVESAALLYCGKGCSVDGDASSLVVYANKFTVGGTVKKAMIYIRNRFDAGAVEVNPREETKVQFRAAQSCLDFGRPIPAAAVAGLRQITRLNYRNVVMADLLRFLETERINIARARIYLAKTGKESEAILSDLRGGHAIHAAIQVLLGVTEAIKETYAVGESLGEAHTGVLVNGALDEAANFVSVIVKEAEGMSKEYVGATDDIDSPCRHLKSFSKKFKEALRLGTGLDMLMYDFDMRLDEWREVAEKARVRYSEILPRIVESLGENVFKVVDCEKLDALATRLEGQVSGTGTSSQRFRCLKQKSTQYASMNARWRESEKVTRQEYETAIAGFFEMFELILSRRDGRGLHVGNMSEGVPIRTLAVCERMSGRDRTAAVRSPNASPYQLRCENLRLYLTSDNTS